MLESRVGRRDANLKPSPSSRKTADRRAARAARCLSEFAPELIVYIADKDGEYRTTTLKKLLPDSFTPAHLEEGNK